VAKGHKGETCAEATREAIVLLGNRASAEDIFNKVKQMGDWTEDNIWQGLMSFVVNLPPGYRHWQDERHKHKFLFLREDGNYELYNPQWHGRYDQGKRVV